jgi:hypothetical protein
MRAFYTAKDAAEQQRKADRQAAAEDDDDDVVLVGEVGVGEVLEELEGMLQAEQQALEEGLL